MTELNRSWVCTDLSTYQHVRRIYGYTFEFYDILQTGYERKEYGVAHEAVNLDGYEVFAESFEKEYLKPYGYDSIEHVIKEYPNEWAQVVAECIFETNSCVYRCVVYGSFEYCTGYIDGKLTGEEK